MTNLFTLQWIQIYELIIIVIIFIYKSVPSLVEKNSYWFQWKKISLEQDLHFLDELSL